MKLLKNICLYVICVNIMLQCHRFSSVFDIAILCLLEIELGAYLISHRANNMVVGVTYLSILCKHTFIPVVSCSYVGI